MRACTKLKLALLLNDFELIASGNLARWTVEGRWFYCGGRRVQ
jgi:hypothetical protein